MKISLQVLIFIPLLPEAFLPSNIEILSKVGSYRLLTHRKFSQFFPCSLFFNKFWQKGLYFKPQALILVLIF